MSPSRDTRIYIVEIYLDSVIRICVSQMKKEAEEGGDARSVRRCSLLIVVCLPLPSNSKKTF
jgi:hypothetical protein